MASTSIKETVRIPSNMAIGDARGIAEDVIDESEAIQLVGSTEDRSEQKVRITVRSAPSMLSWGGEMVITITPSEMRIEGKKPQRIDWGKTEDAVKTFARDVEADLGGNN